MVEAWHLLARDVAGSAAAADPKLQGLQPAVGEPGAPTPPGGMEQIDMEGRQPQRDAMHVGAVPEERRIVGLAVERHDRVEASDFGVQRAQQGALFSIVSCEILPQHEVRAVPVHGASQEHGARREASGLEVEEQQT